MSSIKEKIEQANQKAVETILETNVVWVDVQPALDVIPGMKKNLILHSGPPIDFKDMCPSQKKGVCGAAVYEGLAADLEDAEKKVLAAAIEVAPCHHYQTTGSMTGITSASMPVLVCEDRGHDNYRTFILVHEGASPERIAYGAWSQRVHDNLIWVEKVLGPALGKAIRFLGEMPVLPIIAQSLTMGDECHNRPNAGSALWTCKILPAIIRTGSDNETTAKIAEFLAETDHFFFHFGMCYGKAATDACMGIEYSTIVTTMARNGVEVGVRVAGLPGQWFTGPAAEIQGVYYPGFGPDDANNDMGDSAITETVGLGGFAMAASVPMCRAVGGNAEDAVKYVRQMSEIAHGRHNQFQMPMLDFEGTPLGIDIRKVVQTGILPIICTAIASKTGGQIGVGLARPPMQAFEKALKAFSDKYLVG